MGCGIIHFQLPFLGVRRYVLDPAGMGCSTFILLYWLYGTFALLFIIMIPHYHAGDLSIIPLICMHYCLIDVLNTDFIYLYIYIYTILKLLF